MSFELDLSRFVTLTIAKQNLIVKKTILELDKSIVKKSPVLTGRFKANWRLGVGEIPSGEIDAVDISGAATLARNAVVIPVQAAGPIYYLVNNLSYAQRLEDGYSQQAPSGMVGLTVAEFQQTINEAAR